MIQDTFGVKVKDVRADGACFVWCIAATGGLKAQDFCGDDFPKLNQELENTVDYRTAVLKCVEELAKRHCAEGSEKLPEEVVAWTIVGKVKKTFFSHKSTIGQSEPWVEEAVRKVRESLLS